GHVELVSVSGFAREDRPSEADARALVKLDHPGAGAVVNPFEADGTDLGVRAIVHVQQIASNAIGQGFGASPADHEIVAVAGDALDQRISIDLRHKGARESGGAPPLGEDPT